MMMDRAKGGKRGGAGEEIKTIPWSFSFNARRCEEVENLYSDTIDGQESLDVLDALEFREEAIRSGVVVTPRL